jgi:hypothetical protein
MAQGGRKDAEEGDLDALEQHRSNAQGNEASRATAPWDNLSGQERAAIIQEVRQKLGQTYNTSVDAFQALNAHRVLSAGFFGSRR